MQAEIVFKILQLHINEKVLLPIALIITLVSAGFMAPRPAQQNFATSPGLPIELAKEEPIQEIITGKPLRIVIDDVNINLPVDEGRYNPNDNTWTLSGYHAHFAMISTLVNDNNGNTFIYGHNNRYVFGPLKRIHPGAEAQIYTDSNKIFYYKFDTTYAVTPDNTSVLDYQGPSVLTVQTCSGAWNEQRQMYVFKFDRVEINW